jgi:membrane-bound lytic murein transglycosylase D
MKTMLKRKFKQTGLFSNGLLLATALVSMAATHQGGQSGQRLVSDSTFQLHFDTTLLKLNGVCETDALTLDVPAFTINKQSKKYVQDYLANAENVKTLKRIQEISPASFKVIDAVFTKYKLPLELKYLAVIESELKSKALSRVGARGVWQLMPQTARILSLKVTSKYDERTHLYKSTVAVAKYLTDLYKLFGDWPLVIAAYNSGPGKVYDAIKKSGSRNFWKLQNYLPAETRGHVKKFISTHYYFEGQGSITTLTKDEVAAYKKTMIAFVSAQNALLKEKLDTDTASAVPANNTNEEKNTVVITQTIGEAKLNEKKK